MFRHITRTVLIISLVSLFNDFSSEMLYPVIPIYLQHIGYHIFWIGLLEGVAEFISGLSKIYMGSLSDHIQKRLPFIQLGYALSVLSRPLIGASSWIGLIFAGRSMDRIGKGIRSGARDALLADECNEQNRAEVFGFHRSMDTLGAVLGPLVAMYYLYKNPGNYKALFLITLLPGILALLFTWFIKEKNKVPVVRQKVSFWAHFTFYKKAPALYRNLISILLIFSVANTSDMFLLMRAKEAGFSDHLVLMMYLIFNLSFSLFAYPVGRIADRIGVKKTYLIGLLIYLFTYLLFASTSSYYLLVAAFVAYGLFYAFNQGITKVLLLQTVSKEVKSSAIGFYEGMNSFVLLAANALAGFMWFQFGSRTMLLTSVGLTIVVIALFLTRKSKP
jgi:MFS family permease